MGSIVEIRKESINFMKILLKETLFCIVITIVDTTQPFRGIDYDKTYVSLTQFTWKRA